MRIPMGGSLALALVLTAAAFAGRTAAARKEPVDAGFDHSAYGQLLDRFVNREGLVDYAGLKRRAKDLDTYLSGLAGLSDGRYRSWNDPEKIAFWINAYNAFTLKAIVDHYPIQSSFLTSLVYPKNSIRQIDGVWDELRFDVKGESLTLDHIEHQILRQEFKEPRIHMALVCAAMSCPPLRNEPYTGAQLDRQLEDQSRRFLARGENFSIRRTSGTARVRLSSIFDWFGSDFVPVYGAGEKFRDESPKVRAVLNFAWPHLSAGQQQSLQGASDVRVSYSDYDWTLNEQK